MNETKSVGRPRSFAMEQVLDAAIPVFRRNGFHGTSLSDLGLAMGLAPGSIYKAFSDKRAIYLAALDRYIKVRVGQLRTAIDRESDGLAKIQTFFEHYVTSATGLEGRAGCMVVNAAVEAPSEEQAAARAAASLTTLESFLADIVGEGKRDGSIRADLDDAATARMILSLVQGFRVIGKLGRERAEFTPAVEQLVDLLRP
jgi:AcrR family transcriptional regulator